MIAQLLADPRFRTGGPRFRTGSGRIHCPRVPDQGCGIKGVYAHFCATLGSLPLSMGCSSLGRPFCCIEAGSISHSPVPHALARELRRGAPSLRHAGRGPRESEPGARCRAVFGAVGLGQRPFRPVDRGTSHRGEWTFFFFPTCERQRGPFPGAAGGGPRRDPMRLGRGGRWGGGLSHAFYRRAYTLPWLASSRLSRLFLSPAEEFLHCSWYVFWVFSFLVLFIFTGGLQKKQFFATIPRVETEWVNASRRVLRGVGQIYQQRRSRVGSKASAPAWTGVITLVRSSARTPFGAQKTVHLQMAKNNT